MAALAPVALWATDPTGSYHSVVFLCFGGMIRSVDAVLQGTVRDCSCSQLPGMRTVFSCLVCFTFEFLSPGPDLQIFRPLPFLLKASSSILPLSGLCESLSCGFQSFSVNGICLWFNWEIASSSKCEIHFLCVADSVTQPWKNPITYTQNKLWQPLGIMKISLS